MSVRLLDVNLLIALAWPSHEHHSSAQNWFAQNSNDGWATCPITECGFVRISSNPKIIPHAVSVADAVDELRKMTQLPSHVFWADDVSLGTSTHIPLRHISGHRQVTDGYLVALAIHHGGQVATLDRSMGSAFPAGGVFQRTVVLVPS